MKTALVTGAARRIGARLATELSRMGYRVAIHHRGAEDEAETLAATLRANGGACETFQADLSEPAACAALIAAVHERFGGLEVLVNNASSFVYDTLDSVTAEGWRERIDSNLTAPVFLTQAFAARLAADAEGLVVNLLDQKVVRPNPDYFSYTVGKIALAGLTPMLAMALPPRIRVCGIAPGVTLPSGEQSEDDFERASRATLSGRSSTPDDLARALRFIVETPSFTGQNLVLDGGESLLGRQRDVALDPSV